MNTITPIKLVGLMIGTIILISCGSSLSSPGEPAETEIISSPFPTLSPSKNPSQNDSIPETLDSPQVPPVIITGFTYQQPDGNRDVSGVGSLPILSPVDIQLPGVPNWIVGVPSNDGIIWTIAIQDGSIVTLLSSEKGMSENPNDIAKISPGSPIHSHSSDQQYSLVTVTDPNQSPLTHPIYLPKSNVRAYMTQNGDLNFTDAGEQLLASLPIKALPDARMLIDNQDRILILTDPTNIYNHGVLGDNLEAKSFRIIDTYPTIQVSSTVSLDENEVIEGISPIWVDITGDGNQEIIVTVSDIDLGAGIVIFNEMGERLVEGPKMGQPFRWRHQIAFAPTGPNGENELIVVRTPHIGGVIEYYQYEKGELRIVVEYPGITSHTIGSRNLDMAAAGDFDGDGTYEVLLPTPDLTAIVAISRTGSGAEQVWQLPLGGKLSTNISGASLPNGQMAVAVGRSDGVLRIWMPE